MEGRGKGGQLVPLCGTTPVVWREVPLVGKPRYFHAPEGMSLLEIVRHIPDLAPIFEAGDGIICINGDPVPQEYWQYVRPRANGKCHVTLHLVLEKGGGSKIIASVAALAVLAIAAIAAPLVAGALGFTAGSVGFFAVQGAIGVAGSVGAALLYSALAPPPSTALAPPTDSRDYNVKPASLSGNTMRAGDNLPRVLGYRKVFPPLITQPLVELIGLNEVVEGVYGLAGPHKINQVFDEDVDISSMPEVQYQVTSGFPNAIQQTLVNRQGFVTSPNLLMSAPLYNTTNTNQLQDQGNPVADVPFYHRFVTRTNPDEFWVSLNFAEGLIHTNGNNCVCPIRTRIRVKGTTTWTDLPEIHVKGNVPAAVQVTFKLMWKKAPVGLIPPDPAQGCWSAYYTTPNQNAGNGPFTGGFTCNSYFYSGSGDTFWNGQLANTTTTGLQNMQLYIDRVEFYLDPTNTLFPQAAYEVEVKRGQAVQVNNWWPRYYQNGGGTAGTNPVYDLFGYYLSGTTATLVENQGSIKHKLSIIRLTSVWNQNPVGANAPIATIAVKSTGRGIQQLSCLAGGLCPIPVGGNFDTYAMSTNPADHYRDVLVGTLGAFPLQTSQIDDLTAWRNDCDALGYSINSVVQSMKQMDVLKLIAAAGYGRPIQSETWGVAEDKDRSSLVPTQIFNPRNLQSFQWTKSFVPFTDGLRVTYDDALNLYVETQLVVLDPFYNTGGIRLEDIRYETVINGADAQRRALFDLRQARERLVFYSGTADIENLVCRAGDLVGVNHDILSSEIGYSRVISTIVSSGNITGLVLDDSVPEPVLSFFNNPTLNFFNDPTLNFFNKPERMGICLRCSDGTMLVKEVTGTSGDATTISFVTPFADPGTIVKGCLLGFGPLGTETRRLLVQSIAPKKDLTADITLVDEAPDLWGAKIVTALLHFDGTNGATTTVDSSSYANSVTMTNATLSTASPEFGSASCSFNGTNALVDVTESSNRFNSQTDFTIDFWYKSTSGATGTVCCKGAGTGFLPWRLDNTSSGMLFYSASIANSAWDVANGLNVMMNPNDGNWHHIAITRLGGYFFFFLDGTPTFSFYSSLQLIYSQTRIRLGNYGSQWFNGNIDEFRYTNGLARWITNFNVPVVAGTA